MGFFTRNTREQKLCPNCRKPVAQGTVFCDSCGLRVTPPPTCEKCQLPLAPETNFCEACGTPVGTAPAGPKKGRNAKNRKGKKKAPKKDEFVLPSMLSTEAAGPDSTIVTPGSETKEPGERPGIPSAAPPDVVSDDPSAHSGGGRVPKKVIVVAGITILVLVLALAYLTGFVHVSPPASLKTPAQPVFPSPSPPNMESAHTSTTIISEPSPALPSYVPGPTQVPPENYLVSFQAERDPITNIVDVIFNGGKGQRGIREVLVRLTRSDGQVVSETFRPQAMGEGVHLQGTKYTDRLEVIVTYYTGDSYTVIDRVFAYKKRN